MNVFWSPAYPPNLFEKHDMLFREPDALAAEFPAPTGIQRAGQSFVGTDDPFFRQAIHNTFVARGNVNVSLNIQNGSIRPADDKSKTASEMFRILPSTRKNYAWLQFAHQLIFFCDEPLEVQAWPAFFHKTEAQTRMSFFARVIDCGRWFRPFEAIFEIPSDLTSFQFKLNDPLYYLRFNCSSAINFTRFKMTPELFDIAIGCANYPGYRPQSSIEKVYAQFQSSDQMSRVGTLIRSQIAQSAQKVS